MISAATTKYFKLNLVKSPFPLHSALATRILKILAQTFTCPKGSMPQTVFKTLNMFQIFPDFSISNIFRDSSIFPPGFFPHLPPTGSEVSVSELPKVEALGIELRQTSGYAAPVNVQTGELVRHADPAKDGWREG